MTEMGIAEFTKIKNRVLELVRKDDKYKAWWPSRKFRGFLYFIAENLVQLTPDEASRLYTSIYPEESITCDPQSVMREMFASDVEQNLWFPNMNIDEVSEGIVGFFGLLDAQDKDLLLELHFVYGLVDYLLRTYQESFSLPGSWERTSICLASCILGCCQGWIRHNPRRRIGIGWSASTRGRVGTRLR